MALHSLYSASEFDLRRKCYMYVSFSRLINLLLTNSFSSSIVVFFVAFHIGNFQDLSTWNFRWAKMSTSQDLILTETESLLSCPQ